VLEALRALSLAELKPK